LQHKFSYEQLLASVDFAVFEYHFC
jgi:hypothetical protein